MTSKDLIPEFNPLTDNVSHWLSIIDEYAQMYHWYNRTVSHLALGKLRGPANVWYQSLPTRIFNWQEWKDMLLDHFQPKHDLTKAMTLMLEYKPKSLTNLNEYVFEKLALI